MNDQLLSHYVVAIYVPSRAPHYVKEKILSHAGLIAARELLVQGITLQNQGCSN
jgi:hypothetical protein